MFGVLQGLVFFLNIFVVVLFEHASKIMICNCDDMILVILVSPF